MRHDLMAVCAMAVVAAVTAFDFTVYVLKSAPKRAVLPQVWWWIGALSAAAIFYWYANGQKFN